MAEKFNLASVLGDVSKLNTETEQIVRIELDRIDPDPDNFDSLEGLDELASNIELIGLQQPLRVRPSGDRFIIVSGHRRCAAIQLIRDGGSEQFADGVPCIVEYGEASEAMRKLRLIYANSATRVMSSAEISRQAEEVQRLLYELKEQGVEFPGRMRDHVAEACKISASKLARLHAIRSNLIPEILAAYDRGEVNEDAAYNLSRFPEYLQKAVAARMAMPKVTRWPYGNSLAAVLKDLDQYKLMSCPAKAGQTCSAQTMKILHNMFSYDWEMCRPDKCCLDCAKFGKTCGFMCEVGKNRIKLDKAVEAEKREKQLADAKKNEEIARKRLQKVAANLVRLAERAGLKDSQAPGYGKATVGTLRKVASGECPTTSHWELQPYTFSEAKEWCKTLKCSMSELAGEKVEDGGPSRTPAPTEEDEGDVFVRFAWRIGQPPVNAPGWYAVKVSICSGAIVTRKALYWDGEAWLLNDLPTAQPLNDSNEVTAWFELPEDSEEDEE